MPQVYHIATRIHERLPKHVPLEDLVHEGVLGLMAALNTYDSSKRVQFQTYASFRIRGSILDSLRKMDWASRPLRAKGRRITEAVAELIAMMGRQPTEQEIADHVGMPLAKLQKVVAELDGLTVLGQETFAAFDPSETHDLIESAPSQSEDDPFTLCLRGEMHGRLAQSIGQLSEREQLLLSLYYREELTMREVAEVIGVRQSTGLADPFHDSDQAARGVEPRTRAATGRSPDGTAAGEVVEMMDTNQAIASRRSCHEDSASAW